MNLQVDINMSSMISLFIQTQSDIARLGLHGGELNN